MKIDKNKIIVAVIIIIYALSMFYVWYFFNNKSREPKFTFPEPVDDIFEDEPDIIATIKSEPDVAPILVRGPSVTAAEIFENVEEQGISYCETLEGSDHDSCVDHYWMWRAEIDENPLICDEGSNPGFIRECKERSAVIAVARAYFNESNGLKFDVVPSNIHLCDLIEFESDLDYCLNPKKAIEKNKFELQYMLQ